MARGEKAKKGGNSYLTRAGSKLSGKRSQLFRSRACWAGPLRGSRASFSFADVSFVSFFSFTFGFLCCFFLLVLFRFSSSSFVYVSSGLVFSCFSSGFWFLSCFPLLVLVFLF